MGYREPMDTDKRARLLQAAEEVFVDRGIPQATIEEITARAGVAKGTFYLYFSRKDDLVTALQERLWSGHVELTNRAAQQLLEDGADWWAVTDEFIAHIIEYDYAHRHWHRLIADRPQSSMEPGDDITQQIIEAVSAAILVGVERNVCHAGDPPLAATLLYQAVRGTSHQLCQLEDPPAQERYVAAAQELVHKALAREPMQA